jgi:hypothetical protein
MLDPNVSSIAGANECQVVKYFRISLRIIDCATARDGQPDGPGFEVELGGDTAVWHWNQSDSP